MRVGMKCILAVCSLFFAVGMSATMENTEEHAQYLDSIVAIKEISVVETKYKEVIQPQTLSGEDLERLNSHSVADALRYFSGVQLKDYGGIGGIKTVNIRSMGTNQIGVFYNGIQLGNAQNGQVDLGRYSLDNVEAISLYNGQKSEIFQSAKDFSSSGSIYITTHRPRFSGKEKTHIIGQVKTGSFGLVNPSFVWEQKISDKVHFSANAEYTNANGRYKFRYRMMKKDGNPAYDTTAVRHNGDVEALRTELALYGYSTSSKWNVNGYFYTSERGIPGAIVNNVFRRGERQWDKAAFGQGAYLKRINNFYEIKIAGKFAWDYTHFLRPEGTEEIPVDNSYYQQECYLSVANLFKINNWWEMSFSVDGQMNKLDSNMALFSYPVRWTELASIATSFSLSHLNIQASLLGTFVQEHVRSQKLYMAAPDKHEFSPSVFFSYQPWLHREFRLNGFFKRIFRMPTFNDLYYAEMGNSNLQPEYTYQYDLGSTYHCRFNDSFFDYINLKADVYYNTVTNKIVAYPAGKQFRWTMLNLGKVKIIGTEMSSEIGCHVKDIGMRLLLQYTYQSARDYTDSRQSNYKDQIPYIPWHSGSVAYGADYKGWSFNYSFIYTGERYNDPDNIAYNYEPAWYTHDLSLSKTFRVWQCDFRLTGELNNVFNQSYEVIHNYPMPGRNFKIILKANW